MMKQSGFTVKELAISLIVLVILGAIALSKFYDIRADAAERAAKSAPAASKQSVHA